MINLNLRLYEKSVDIPSGCHSIRIRSWMQEGRRKEKALRRKYWSFVVEGQIDEAVSIAEEAAVAVLRPDSADLTSITQKLHIRKKQQSTLNRR